MKIAVVTVTYNSANVLPEFLASFAAQDAADIELHVVDNDSRDETLTLVEAARTSGASNIHIIANRANLGVAEANNQGILAGLANGAEWIVLLNNDTIFAPTTLRTLIEEGRTAGASIITPTIEATEPPRTIWYVDGKIYTSQALAARHLRTGMPLSELPGERVKVEYAPTCALAIKRDVFRHTGLMDPIYFVYHDDVDFAIRARRLGFDYWLTPAAHIIHKASSLTGGKASAFTIYWTSRNWVVLNRLNRGRLLRAYSYTYIASWAAARLLLRRDSLATTRARLAAYREGFRLDLSGRAGRIAVATTDDPAGFGGPE